LFAGRIEDRVVKSVRRHFRVTTLAGCLICGSARKDVILDLGRQPVLSRFSGLSPAGLVVHELALAVCHACGLVQLDTPFPFRDLQAPYDWIIYREPESHLDAVAARLLQLLPSDRHVTAAGLSSKDRTTLDRLKERGFSSTWIVDPREDLGTESARAGIETVQALLKRSAADNLCTRRGFADVVVARHILEHTEEPLEFLAALTAMLAPNGVLVVEVPDCSDNFGRQDYTAIWEEHTLYFTQSTVRQALAKANCNVLALETHVFPFENVLVAYARKGAPGDVVPDRAADPEIACREVDVAQNFGAAFPFWTQQYGRVLERLTSGGKPVAAYGAGHLTGAFINFHGLAEYFAFVVDDSTQKQGLQMPGSGLAIVPNAQLTADTIDACLLGLAPQNEDVVIAKNAGYSREGGKFYSMLVDSRRSIRALAASSRTESGLCR
jgi:C-methyltransferase C-terminal domain/Methyltransferase domain/Putative zinc binding domain